ncbi:uncharacterized protein CcaverHIS019_0703240 [Cutaneotrichosporon cavernicola]|uniref:Uncharacterized protein n=1 Tax=Cutaneotrichosporon cavernicola TaxID=279322 RepID=A0AA48QYV6_9TREE|nr:uncharacterized protein CcaverHIS019_0703240 [Cutaneotrichosporon cavernicola]BEI94743.1 hypothetical protein CcaverHIS019_0703240 [Cutaneotrichosporon cavernicola]BEJ02518.1 hypothetical protein CcaverHIS631_0703130 [Cutaneotrichosporon cavernicola]BEJ10276.1 hypothetical protein CcaverHIS641_0703110 [Cutaneotrichosporon cavernicola]
MTVTLTVDPPTPMKGVLALNADAGVLDTTAHPSILKRLIALAPHDVKLTFREVSRTARGLADDILFGHVVVAQWGSATCYDKGRTSLFALLTPAGDKLPGKPMSSDNKHWKRRLAHTDIMDSTVRLPSFQWETIVHEGRPRVLRRLISGGLWRASPNLTAVDLLVLSPLSLSCRLGQDMLTASLVAKPKKHVINILLDLAYRGAHFPVGSAGERHNNAAVLIFSMLPIGGALHRHLYYPGDDDPPVTARIMNLTSPGEDFFDSLATVVASGVYNTYTLVGLHEIDHHIIGTDHYLEPKTLKARIVNLVRARQHRSSAMGLPPHIPAAELEQSLTLVSHHDYRLMIGAEQYEIETWPQAPARWWAP